MEPADITVEILKSIRDEVRGTREETHELRTDVHEMFTGLSSRIDETNMRFDKLAKRQVEAEVRLATELASVTGAVCEVRDLLRDDLGLRRRVDDHEARLAALEQR